MTVIIAVIRSNYRGNYWTEILKTGGKTGRWLHRQWRSLFLPLFVFEFCSLLISLRENGRGIIVLTSKVNIKTDITFIIKFCI